MGVSAAMIYNTKNGVGDRKEKSLFTYGVSLFVNFCWSIFFFNMRLFLFSFLWLVILWILILKTILEYAKINRVAAYLQIPYLIWVTFAGYLNFGIWLLNR
jgi:tryptophan-rich sensory protein